MGSFYCGKMGASKWIPGRLVKKYFYSHQAEKKNLLQQLRTASKTKKKKLQAQISALGKLISARSPLCATGGPGRIPKTSPLKFNLSGAIGLTLKNPEAQSLSAFARTGQTSKLAVPSSNLQKVSSAGTVSSVVSSGSATVSNFLIAPNDKLYVLFARGTNLDDTNSAGNCLLAEVNKLSGVPTCIESELVTINVLDRNSYWALNTTIQFDDTGAIYYVGNNANGNAVLRRNVGGTKTDLINDNIRVFDFVVLDDGRVIIAGNTKSTNADWVRRISVTGGLTTLFPLKSFFLHMFPDGNVYVGGLGGFGGAGGAGVDRYLSQSDAVEEKPYIGHDSQNPHFPISLVCDETLHPRGFCGGYGGLVRKFYSNTNNEVFAISDGGSGATALMRYFPTLERLPTVVSTPLVLEGVGVNLVVSGLTSSSRNVMTMLNTSDNSEIQLIGPDNEIEIYHLNYVASSNKIMFDGLRFSDNKYVIGQFDLNTMTFSASQTGSTKLVDFQTF